MSDSVCGVQFAFVLDAEAIGRLFMANAGNFEVVQSSAIQDEYLVDSIDVASPLGKCRLAYCEWEENNPNDDEKWWVSEYAIELTVGQRIAYGTYRLSYSLDQGNSGAMLDRLREDAENDFMLCCKLIGRSVRRDLVVDEDITDHTIQSQQLH